MLSLCSSVFGEGGLKIIQELGIPDHLTCLLRNLYADQEATELDMEQQTGSKWGKESRLYIVLMCRVHHVKYHPGIKIARRNKLRYADDTILMAGSKN